MTWIVRAAIAAVLGGLGWLIVHTASDPYYLCQARIKPEMARMVFGHLPLKKKPNRDGRGYEVVVDFGELEHPIKDAATIVCNHSADPETYRLNLSRAELMRMLRRDDLWEIRRESYKARKQQSAGSDSEAKRE